MPTFDIPGRQGPASVVLYPGGRERTFRLPYYTDDPVDIALLRKYPRLEEIKTSRRTVPEPAAFVAADEPEAKPTKPSRKGVENL